MAYPWEQIVHALHDAEARRRRRGEAPGTADRAAATRHPWAERYCTLLGALSLSVAAACMTLIANFIVTVWLLHLHFD